MFKKKKQIVNEAVENKSAQKPSKAKRRQKGEGKSLSGWIYQPALGVLLCFGLLFVLLELMILVPAEQLQKELIVKSNMSAATYELDAHIADRKTTILSVVKSLKDSEETKSVLRGVWPELKEIYVVKDNDLENLKGIYPDISFASIDLFRRAAATDKAIVEAFYNDKKWFYQIAAGIKADGKDIVESQTIVAVLDISALKNIAKKSPMVMQGRMDLVTETGRAVFGFGNGIESQAVSTRLSVPQWSLRFSPSDNNIVQIDRLLTIIAFGVMSLLALIILVMLTRVQIAKIRKDIQSLSQFISKKLISGKATKNLAFNEFGSAADAFITQFDEHSAKLTKEAAVKKVDEATDDHSKTEGEKQPGTELNSNAEMEADDAPLFDDDLLDLDELDAGDGLDQGVDSSMVTEVKSLADDVSQSIFRAYDIRGIVDETLTEGVVELIGKAIATEAIALGQNKLCVGFDGRISSIDYCQALSRGITSTGVDVIIVGQVPTPLLYFSTHHFETGSGVMITGSHNPSNYNGFKIMLAGKTLSGDDIQKLYNRIIIQDFASGQGNISEQSVTQEYMDTILNDIAVAAPLKVVVDAGNGVAGGIAPGLIEELGCEVIPLYCDVDGNFPNHHPDPGKPENLQDLINAVQEHDADLGLAFDGDGDRLGVVTNTGKIIWPDRLLMLFAKDVVSRNPGADILFDVKCSRRLNGLISSYGGRPIMWKTGHSLVKAKMKETGALLAGEMSGHIFFKERWYGFDDGIYSAVRLLEVLGIEDRTADEVFADFPEDVSTPEINITVTDESKFQLVEKLCLLKGQFEGGNVSTIDGLRVDYPNGWGLCRASNTTPVLVLRFEADDEIALEEIKDKFKVQLNAVDPGLNLDF